MNDVVTIFHSCCGQISVKDMLCPWIDNVRYWCCKQHSISFLREDVNRLPLDPLDVPIIVQQCICSRLFNVLNSINVNTIDPSEIDDLSSIIRDLCDFGYWSKCDALTFARRLTIESNSRYWDIVTELFTHSNITKQCGPTELSRCGVVLIQIYETADFSSELQKCNFKKITVIISRLLKEIRQLQRNETFSFVLTNATFVKLQNLLSLDVRQLEFHEHYLYVSNNCRHVYLLNESN